MFGEQRTFYHRLRLGLRIAAAIGVTALSLVGCYSPDLSSMTDCTLPCVSECPSGSECRNNFCARIASSATCASEGGSGAVSGTGAVGGSDPITNGGGGSGGVAGNAGAGSGGEAGAVSAPFDVRASAIPTLCPGQGFVVQLSAVDGVAPYTWSLLNDGATGAHLSATAGLSVEVSGIAGSSAAELKIKAKDASGASVITNFALSVGVAGPGECPQITATRLPDPCLENDYLGENVLVTGGTSPFVWDALSIPEGLGFDPTTQVVSGTALPAGMTTPLTLRVTDRNGRQTQMTYPLAYRDRCWLGFVSAASSSAKLRLFDPALTRYAPALEASSNNAGVVDFKFSPDGKFLVYRRSSGSPSAQSLVLAAAPTWQEQVLDFGGSVLEYSWSDSGSVLAVAYRTDTDTMLGGVVVTNAVASASSAGGIVGAELLTPVVMLDPTSAPLQSELLWFQGDKYLAFHADSLLGFEDFPYYSHFDGTGFSAPTAWDETIYDPSVELLPAHNGVFAVEPVAPPQLFFYGSPGGTDFNNFLRTQYTSAVADPAGSYVALPKNDKLQIELTAESGGGEDVPTDWLPSTDECTSILAWDASRERIACDVRGTPPDGEVRIFDLAGTEATPQLSSVAVKGLSGYQQGASSQHRRTFSPSGKWFAFITDAGLNIGDMQSQPQMLTQIPLLPGSTPSSTSELVFSPNESLLLWQLGQTLSATQVEKNGSTTWYTTTAPLLSPAPCNEEFTAGPSTWCGRHQTAKTPTWSPDSQFVAAKTATNGVALYDFHDYGAVSTIEACASDCPGELAFQPSDRQSQPP